ncbi:hypothetical protein KMP13_20150 [Epibacterium ulvae]|uniref:hypothetical protein n=1 Tax=Epibacterium ulvae TaxID=1156985 RepID=UPI001BFC2728|nr:hypothetical protein [Epibacterium ulvae]MBT8156128.1 hypothetical protein [Epibacterium ulvae]
MIGVVLWNDTSKNAAVIWCEDHGDLAFYYGDPTHDLSLHSGDCVLFKVELKGSLRHARELTLVEGESRPALAASLANMGLGAELPGSDAPQIHATTERAKPASGPYPNSTAHVEKTGELVIFASHHKSKKQNTARRVGACRVVRMF